MKTHRRLLALGILLLIPACSFTSPLGGKNGIGRLFPDGSSFEIIDGQLIVTGTGGTLSAKSIKCVGTNGFPLSIGGTNQALAK